MTIQRSLPNVVMSLLAAVSASGLMASGDQKIVNAAPRPHIAVPLVTTTPLVTAMEDDRAWNNAALITLNTRSLSTTTLVDIPIPETEVRLLWDPEWLYVRFLCKDDQTYLPVHGHNAPIWRGDAVEIFLDPVGDCREWLELEFNATNDVFDTVTLCTGEPKSDTSLVLTDEVSRRDIWVFPDDGELKALRSAASSWKVNGQSIGWIVDVAIPASILRRTGLKNFGAMTLRGDFLRCKWVPKATGSARNFLSVTWSPITEGNPHRSPAAFGFIDLTATNK